LSMMLKSAVFAPIPSARTDITMAENPALLRRLRKDVRIHMPYILAGAKHLEQSP
jgi:hypothetical protein